MGNVKLKYGFKAEAERIGLRFREELNLKPHDHLCAFVLANHLRVDVIGHHETNISTAQAKEIGKSNSGWSAFTLKNSQGIDVIVHNSFQSEARQQSNMMHELSHIICKHKLPPPTLIANLALPFRNYDPEIEEEAKWLGGCLQIPKEGLIWAVKKNMTREEVAEHFKASEQMVGYRFNMSGVKHQFSRSKIFYSF